MRSTFKAAILAAVSLTLVPPAAAAAAFSATPAERAAEPPAVQFSVVPNQVFHIETAEGTRGVARLILDRAGAVHSCFTVVPLAVQEAFAVSIRIRARQDRFTCFGGFEPLQLAALRKEVVPAGDAKVLPREEEEYEDEFDWNLLVTTFWDALGLGGSGGGGGPAVGGGGQCMQECNMALGAALRFCAVAPDPIRELCALGAGGLYIVCIANC
jgi:hypothetical protein